MTGHCPNCDLAMPDTVIHNQKHTCRCGYTFIVIRVADGRLKWLFTGSNG